MLEPDVIDILSDNVETIKAELADPLHQLTIHLTIEWVVLNCTLMLYAQITKNLQAEIDCDNIPDFPFDVRETVHLYKKNLINNRLYKV